MRARTVGTIVLLAMLVLASGVQADEVQEAVQTILASHTAGQVTVQFDVKRTDGTGGQEVKAQGLVVGADGLVLVTGASQVDPKPGSGNARPETYKIVFPGDEKAEAVFVGKDEETNLALLRIKEDEIPEGLAPVAFDAEAALTPGQQLIIPKRLDKGDDDLVTFTVARITAVIPRPGLPPRYRILGSFNGFEGCPVYTLDAKLAGFVTGGARRGRGARFRFVNGRMQRISGGGGGGGVTRILDTKTVGEFLADPTRFARRDCWLGVSGLQALTKELAEACGIEKPGGLMIGKVSERSPAERAGFKAGDVLVAMDGEPVDAKKDRDIASFNKTVRRAKAAEEHRVSILRPTADGAYAEMTVTVAFEESPLKESEVAAYHDKEFGLKLKPLTRDFLESNRLPLDTRGVRVTWVESAGWASIAGIQSGDVIQKMVLKKCPDLETYKKIMADLMTTRDSEVCYNVTRRRKSLFVCVRPDWWTIPEFEK